MFCELVCVLPINLVFNSAPLLLEYTKSELLSSKFVAINWLAPVTLSVTTLSNWTLFNMIFTIEMSPFACTTVTVASPFVLRVTVNCTVSLFEDKLNSRTGAWTSWSDASTVRLQSVSWLTYNCNKVSLDRSNAGGLVALNSVVQVVVIRSLPSGSVKMQLVVYPSKIV